MAKVTPCIDCGAPHEGWPDEFRCDACRHRLNRRFRRALMAVTASALAATAGWLLVR